MDRGALRPRRTPHPDEVLWAYCHPYDFDPGEPFQKRPDLGPWKSRLQWINRRRMFDRVDRLFAQRRAAAGERSTARI